MSPGISLCSQRKHVPTQDSKERQQLIKAIKSLQILQKKIITQYIVIYIFLKDLIIVWDVSSIDSMISALVIKYFITEQLHAFITSQQH